MRRSWKLGGVLAVTGALALSACSSSKSDSSKALPTCPVDALANATGPVEITMWHAMPDANTAAMDRLAAAFNSSQSKVKVKLIFQTTYDQLFQKVQAGKTTGDLPEVAKIEDRQMQSAVNTELFVPAQSCMNADNYSMSDYVPRVVDMFKLDGQMQAMPFNVSIPILYFDQTDFVRAGLDPKNPPKTFAELKAAAQKLKAAGVKEPMSFDTQAWYFEQWHAMANEYFVNNENGRKELATKATFGDKTGQDVFAFLADMKKDGLIKNYKRDTFGNLFAIAGGDSTMTLYSTAALGPALVFLGSGANADKDVKLGVGPMPGPTGGDTYASGAGLYLTKSSKPEKIAAAWEWVKYLNSASAQATWAVETGFLPITKSAASEPKLQEYWAKQPEFKLGYDQLTSGKSNNATAGPLVGPATDVRKAVEDAMTAVLDNNASPNPTLKTAVTQANAALADYAQRAGK